MFTCETQPGPGGLLTWVLRSGDGAAECHVIPERGGLVTKLRFGPDDVLFMDESTLVDRTKNVRGGIPVLFPQAGRLPGDTYTAGGRSYSLRQHGFARATPWVVAGHETADDAAQITCRLTSTDESLAAFPWAFVLRLTYVLHPKYLEIQADLSNMGLDPMPHALGFHPYFRVRDSEKHQAGIRTDATEALDNMTGDRIPVRAIDLTARELDLHLLNHSSQETVLRRGSAPRLRLHWDPGFTVLVLWTLAGRDFVCVEPWEALAGALESKIGLPWLAPGTTVRRTLEIASVR